MVGTVRTVYNLAEGLSRSHDVEIVSLSRKRKKPFFQLPEGVRLVPLSDSGAGADAADKPSGLARLWWSRKAEQIIPEAERARNQNYSPEAVSALRRYLRTTDADVVMGTRPGDRKSTRLNSSHVATSYAVFCLKKQTNTRSNPS